MAKRPTIADLAKTSGVSVATIDRVLNGRLPVREETARRVYDAANAIGYHAAGLIKQRLQQDLPQYRLGFILQRPNQAFYQAFARELELAVNAATEFPRHRPGRVPGIAGAVGDRGQARGMSPPAARPSPWWRSTTRPSPPRWSS